MLYIEEDSVARRSDCIMADRTDIKLPVKFRHVASSLFEEPLGWCGLVPGRQYEIVRFQRCDDDDDGHIRVYFRDSYEPWYVLPRRYSRMVTDKDIFNVNSGVTRYLLCKVIHHYRFNLTKFRIQEDPNRPFTFDLELTEIPWW